MCISTNIFILVSLHRSHLSTCAWYSFLWSFNRHLCVFLEGLLLFFSLWVLLDISRSIMSLLWRRPVNLSFSPDLDHLLDSARILKLLFLIVDWRLISKYCVRSIEKLLICLFLSYFIWFHGIIFNMFLYFILGLCRVHSHNIRVFKGKILVLELLWPRSCWVRLLRHRYFLERLLLWIFNRFG